MFLPGNLALRRSQPDDQRVISPAEDHLGIRQGRGAQADRGDRAHAKSSTENTCPAATSRDRTESRMRSASLGRKPHPGRRKAISQVVKRCPCERSRAATQDRRKSRRPSCADAAGWNSAEPRLFSMLRIASVNERNSPGSAEKRWSGPGRFLSSVKCFSMKHAPKAIAPIAATFPTE